IKLGQGINQLVRKECLRRLRRFPDIEIESLPVDGINREGLGSEPGHAFKLCSCRLCDLPYTCLTESALIAETNQDCDHVSLLSDADDPSQQLRGLDAQRSFGGGSGAPSSFKPLSIRYLLSREPSVVPSPGTSSAALRSAASAPAPSPVWPSARPSQTW